MTHFKMLASRNGIFTAPVIVSCVVIMCVLSPCSEGLARAATMANEVQISLGSIIGIGATIAGAAMTAYVALLRYTIGQEKQRIIESTKRLEHGQITLETKIAKVDAEMGAIKMEFVRVQSDGAALSRALIEVKNMQVPRNEWEVRMDGVEKQLLQILNRLDKNSGLYSMMKQSKE